MVTNYMVTMIHGNHYFYTKKQSACYIMHSFIFNKTSRLQYSVSNRLFNNIAYNNQEVMYVYFSYHGNGKVL